ncbi:MAG: HIT family protein [Nanoarchaeota archaeon]
MDNPLSKEQIEELNMISQLPIEEQKKELPGFLKTLSREQVEFLKRQQGTSCPYCAIAEGKIEARKVYEDENLIGALEINPANKGHVVLFPKKHYEILNQIEDVGHLFNIAKRISGAIFESVKAEGTNIFVSNGASAGQTVPHVAVHIVPRFKDDKFKLGWEKADIKDKEMDKIREKIFDKLDTVSGEKDEIKEIEVIKDLDESYEIKRIP